MYTVKNAIESLVYEKLKDIQSSTTLKCSCDKCIVDIVAYTLNDLKPHYVTTQKGETIVKTNTLNHQITVDVIKALSRAIQLVGENPRHENIDPV